MQNDLELLEEEFTGFITRQLIALEKIKKLQIALDIKDEDIEPAEKKVIKEMTDGVKKAAAILDAIKFARKKGENI